MATKMHTVKLSALTSIGTTLYGLGDRGVVYMHDDVNDWWVPMSMARMPDPDVPELSAISH